MSEFLKDKYKIERDSTEIGNKGTLKNNIFFKVETTNKCMANKYLLYELSINKKFARTPQITWAEAKDFIFKIFDEISKKNLFKTSERTMAEYNIYENYGDNHSLCVCPLRLEHSSFQILDSKMLNPDENQVLTNDIISSQVRNNPFIFLFYMGIISHKDAVILEEGTEKKIYDYAQGRNAGILYKTPFGIVVSDKLQKIIIIKKSNNDFSTIGVSALLDYLQEKSGEYRAISSGHTIKINSFVKDRDFDPDDIASLFSMNISINSDLIKEYRQKTGQNDLFYNLWIKNLLRIFKNGRTIGFDLNFSEEGDEDAIALFRETYSSFLTVQGEEVDRLFNRFKICYEKISGGTGHVNFKREKIYRYEEPIQDKTDFANILDAFIWLKKELNAPTHIDG